MKTFSEYKTTVLGLFDSVSKFSVQVGYESIASNVIKIQKELSNKELIIVTCGEMKRGKSSLLTAFLEEPQIFPIDINTCTNVVTIVQYGEKERIEVIFENNEKVLIKRSEIEKYVTEDGNENNQRKVNFLNVTIPNEKLKEGFVFVDTPGVGSLNFEHAQMTYGFMPNTDVMLFVSDVLNPLTDSELKFLERGFGYCKNIIFPLTKSDKKSKKEIEETIANNKEKICSVTKLSPDAIHMIPVSNKMKLKYLEKNQENDLIKSNFLQLEKQIWKTIFDNRTRILILPFLLQLQDDIQRLKSNINIQINALNQDIETNNRLTEELKEKSVQRGNLLEGTAKWKSDLQYNLSNLSIEIDGIIQQSNVEINVELGTLLSRSGAQDRVYNIASEINEMLTDLVFQTRDMISSKVIDINNEISNELGLNLDINESAMDRVGFIRQDEVEYKRAERRIIDKAIDNGRKVASKSIGLGAIGTIAGGIIGTVFGFFTAGPVGAIVGAKAGASIGVGLGAAAGTVKGAYDAVVESATHDIPAIRLALSNYITKSIGSIRSGVNLCTRELTKGLTDDLSQQIKDQIIQIDAVMLQIKENQTLNSKEIPARKNKLLMQQSIADGFDNKSVDLSNELA